MATRASLLLLAVLLAGPLIGGHTVAADDDDARDGERDRRIAALIAQLGAEQFAQRQAAEEALIAIGRPVLEAVKKAVQSDDPEVAHRADRVWTAIEPVRLRLHHDKRDYLIGETITITYALTNHGDDVVKYNFGGDYRGTGRHERFDIKVIDAADNEAPDARLNVIDMGGITGFYELKKGESFRHEIELLKYRAINAAGEYTVRISHDLGWDVKKSPPPVAETKLTVRLPNAEEARALIKQSDDLSKLRHPIFLPFLLDAARKGDRKAVAGLASIQTAEATKAVIDLITETMQAKSPDVEHALALYGAVADRLPNPRFYDGNHDWYKPHRALVKKTWRDEFADPLRRFAAQLARSEEMHGMAELSFIYECVGTPDDLSDLARGFTKAIERTKTLPFETHQYFRPRGSAYQYRFSSRRLLERGAKPPTDPQSTGEAAIFFIAMHRGESFRPQGWQDVVLKWLKHDTPYMREFVLDHMPEPMPSAALDLLPAMLADEYVDLQIAACHTVGRHPRDAFAEPIRTILKTGAEEHLLNAAAKNAAAVGITADQLIEIWLDRQADDDLGVNAFIRALLAVIDDNRATTPQKLSPQAKAAATRAWRRFLSEHRDALRAGKRFTITDPAITADLFPTGLRFYRDGKAWPADAKPE